tara:strand:+ start:1721 stop:2131 length:411 start_codon:yes stop_codon:yes gene_type:complete
VRGAIVLIFHQNSRQILLPPIIAEAMEQEYVVQIESEESTISNPLGVVSVIWRELSGGIGPWGALRPLFAVALSLVPFMFLGQHFNRQHRKGAEWFLIQFPLIMSIVLWPILFVWSIADAWWVSSGIVASSEEINS